MREKLKSYLHNDQLFYGCLVVLVGVVSFGLGQASVAVPAKNTHPSVVISKPPALETNLPTENGPSSTSSIKSLAVGELIASKSGTKYHLPNCPGAKQIKPENIITFSTAAAAQAAGYTPAANCPGLR